MITNKRGFITPFIVFGIMVSSSLFLAVAYKSIAINNVRVSEADTNLNELIAVRTAYERINGALINESFKNGIVEFDDIHKSIQFEQVKETNKTITIKAIVIDNKTNKEYGNMYKKITLNKPVSYKLDELTDMTNTNTSDE